MGEIKYAGDTDNPRAKLKVIKQLRDLSTEELQAQLKELEKINEATPTFTLRKQGSTLSVMQWFHSTIQNILEDRSGK